MLIPNNEEKEIILSERSGCQNRFVNVKNKNCHLLPAKDSFIQEKQIIAIMGKQPTTKLQASPGNKGKVHFLRRKV